MEISHVHQNNSERGLKRGGQYLSLAQREKNNLQLLFVSLLLTCANCPKICSGSWGAASQIWACGFPAVAFAAQPHPWSGCSHHCGHADF